MISIIFIKYYLTQTKIFKVKVEEKKIKIRYLFKDGGSNTLKRSL